MEVTVEFSEEMERVVGERARQRGMSLGEYVQEVVNREAERPDGAVDSLLRDRREEVEREDAAQAPSRMTSEEYAAHLERLKQRTLRGQEERRQKRAA